MEYKKDIERIHDKSYKEFFSNKEVFKTLIESFINKDILDGVNIEDLELIDKSFILDDFSEEESDIVYKINKDGNEIFIYVLLEFQSTVDQSMPIRLNSYMNLIWRRYLKDKKRSEVKAKDFKLPPIIPIVLYNGKRKWTVPLEFKEKINYSDILGDSIINFKYKFLNVNEYTKEELVDIGNVVAAIFLLDQEVDIYEFLDRIKRIAISFNKMSVKDREILKGWIRTILTEEAKEQVSGIEEIISIKKEEAEAMTSNAYLAFKKFKEDALREGLKEGLEKGMEQGIEQGIEQGMEKVAKNLLNMNMAIEDIVKATGLSKERICRL